MSDSTKLLITKACHCPVLSTLRLFRTFQPARTPIVGSVYAILPSSLSLSNSALLKVVIDESLHYFRRPPRGHSFLKGIIDA